MCSAITADIQCAKGPACEPVTAMVAVGAEEPATDSVVAEVAGGEVADSADSGDFSPAVVVVPCSPDAASPTGLHTAKAFCKRRKLAGESHY